MGPSLFSLCLALPALAQVQQAQADYPSRIKDLLGIPYVVDGAQDERGRYTFFSRQGQEARELGLNCSGFAVVLARRLLNRAISLEEAARDRLGDSGAAAPLGRDWDFAWDLMLNLSEGRPRRVILPNRTEDVRGDGRSQRGFPLEDAGAWARILPQVRRDRIYFASISRGTTHRPRHYHAAVLLRDARGSVWFYQTLPRGRSHHLEISSSAGFARMQGMFGPGKQILILEVEPPRPVD